MEKLWNYITRHKITTILVAIFLIIILVGGFYAINFFSKKFFVEDFNAMNQYYKQTLFETGQEKRSESITNYGALVFNFEIFQKKYTEHWSYALHNDKQLASDLEKIRIIIENTEQDVHSGDLKKAHLELEQVRPMTQEIFKRNGFSLLAVALVDFHDSMEKVLDTANAKNSVGVITAYIEANDKLIAVENEANDLDIQAIRNNLDALLRLAQDNNVEVMPAKAGELKSSFVKVYLKRG